jgi:biopolymer transport protein ExbD
MLRLPEASSAAIERTQSKPLVISVSQSGAYRVNDRELVNSSADTLRNALLKVAGADRSGVVLVRADARTTHQSVVTAMDVLGKLGFRDINIATVDAGSRAGTR